jgi:acyl-CoA oxidase
VQLLCSLYGLRRLELNSGFYLGAGALDGAAVSSVREHVNAACALLGANKGALALRLCAGFGVPDHLIAAPIAQDWRRIVT